MRAQVVHDLFHFVDALTQPQHQAGLGGHMREPLFVSPQEAQGVLIVCPGSDVSIQAGYGFQVVIEDVGGIFAQYVQCPLHAPAKVGHQYFDGGCAAPPADMLYAVGEVTRAAVVQVVPIYGGDDRITQFQLFNRRSQVLGFVVVQRQRPAVRHVTERAAPRAYVAHDHERRGTVAEAFCQIGA